MKKTGLLFLFVFAHLVINAQIVSISDSNFKNALLNHFPVIDVNNDGEIQISEALNTTYMRVWNSNISSLQGIEYFTNLTSLNCINNNLISLDITQNTNLTNLTCANNQLTSLNVFQNINLTQLTCSNNELTLLDISQNTELISLNFSINQIETIDLSQNTQLQHLHFDNNQISEINLFSNPNLTELWCSDNLLSTLDISHNYAISTLQCRNNPNLTYINLNNGNNDMFLYFDNLNYASSHFENLPNLQTVCVDELNTNLTVNILNQVGHSVNFTTGCYTTFLEKHTTLNFKLYPIPTKNILFADSNTPIVFIEIYNQLGQLLLFKNSNSIVITELTKGVYFCKVINELGDVGVKKIIKQ